MLKKNVMLAVTAFVAALSVIIFSAGCTSGKQKAGTAENEEEDGYDGIEQAMLFEMERTKDPALGRIPVERLWQAKASTEQAKAARRLSRPDFMEALSWQERGPNGDFTAGGNPRPAGQQTSGRIRAMMVDSTDPTRKTVWAGGVDGGLWKTTDITVAPSPWVLVNDFLSNLAVSAICQDPRPGFQNTMYFCTGESFRNADAVRGVGVFKSTDGGATWNFLSSTSVHILGTRIVCDFQGNVYLATRNSAGAPGGLYRSTDGGNSWTNITPAGVGSQSICDLEISSTAGPARLHMVTGIGSSQTYRYTDIPATVTSASGWNAPATAFPSFNERCEIAVMGNTLYALPVDNATNNVPVIYKSTDGGANWAATASQPTSGWASGQGWYSLSCGINPANPDECIIGGLDCFKTSNGGTSWVKISGWATSTTGFYIHADQHNVQWWDGGNKLAFACDGGVHYSSNGGITNSDRNQGLRLKQFYSVAIHPNSVNHFIGGTQDNGMHKLDHPGLDSSKEVVGGDGGYSAIDQNEPQFQFGSYVNNVYRRSVNNGATWTTPVNLSTGRFINPWDYDNNTNIIYACNSAGNYLRWDNPQTGGTTNVITVSAFGTGNVSAVHCSPYTAHRVFFGTGSATLFRVDNANTATPTATAITPGGASGYLNCVVTGSSDNNLIATYSSYGVTNVFVSTNGGTTWTASDGNLPDMPVRWALFHPDTDTKAYIATETGVWETDLLNGASTVWVPNTTFPNVRTDMIKYRSSDRTIAAGTHGRGIWTATIPAPTGFSFVTPPPTTNNCPAPGSMSVTLSTTNTGGFSNPITLSAIAGVPPLTFISFGTNPVAPGSSSTVVLNNANLLAPGTYNVTIQGTATGATTQTVVVTYTINPGTGPAITGQPAPQSVCAGANASFSVTATGTYQWQVSTDGGTTWANISGATASTLTLTAVTAGMNGNQYRCVVSNACGSTNSNGALLTVNTGATITAQPADATVCTGQTHQLCVTATGNGLTYQWETAPTCAGPFTNVVGANSSCLTITGSVNAAYRCRVTASGGCGGALTSNCATVTVVSAVTITTQPNNQTVCEGGNANFTVGASGTGLSYQWQISTNGGGTFTNISGATSSSYSITGVTVALNNNQYRCIVSNGVCPTPGTSNAAVLTVNTLPAISSNPQNATLCVGGSNTFTVAATGTGIGYQWQLSTDGGVTYNNIGGATSSSYTVSAVTIGMNGNRYRCVVTGTCSPAATSAAALLTVIAPVTIATQPANAEVCSGSGASFIVAGNSAQPINYQWQVSTDGGTTWTNITGANGSTFTIASTVIVMNNNRYRCLLSNAACTAPATSAAAVLTVRLLPTVTLTQSPVLSSLLPGQTTTLTATTGASTGGTFSTIWTYNTNPLAVSGNSYTVNVERTGAYQVQVRETWPSGLFCAALSQVVNIDAGVSSRLFIYPSPNDGNFTVSYYNNGGASVQRQMTMFDSKGALVYSRKFMVNGAYTLVPVSVPHFNTGVYLLVVGDASGKRLAEGKVHIR